MLDCDSRAIQCARIGLERNALNGTVLLRDGAGDLAADSFDLVLSNPPTHAGSRKLKQLFGQMIHAARKTGAVVIVDGSATPPRFTLVSEEGRDGATSVPGDCCCVAVVRRRARAAGSWAASVIGASSRPAGWFAARGETSADRATTSLEGRTVGKVAGVGCPAAAASSLGSTREVVNCGARGDLAIWPGRSDRGCGDG